MALSRAKKNQLLEGYEAELASASDAFVVGFKGISVIQATELRSRIRAKGGHYVVVKNTLARRAVEGKPLEQVREQFFGPTAIAYGSDPVSIAKVLTEFAKESPVLEFKGGLVEGRLVLELPRGVSLGFAARGTSARLEERRRLLEERRALLLDELRGNRLRERGQVAVHVLPCPAPPPRGSCGFRSERPPPR